MISGNVPQGADLSSSAALEVAVGKLQQLYHLPQDDTELALSGQQAENLSVGCHCSMMEQLSSALGEKDNVLLIDYRSLKTQAVSLPEGIALVIINSNFKRTLIGSEYNAGREQCEAGARYHDLSRIARRFSALDGIIKYDFSSRCWFYRHSELKIVLPAINDLTLSPLFSYVIGYIFIP